VNRRQFLKTGGVLAASTLLASPQLISRSHSARKLLVLGFDGMDPRIVRLLVEQGRLPAFRRLMERGTLQSMFSTDPPASPVAWASFITGLDPAGHGIFDFVHRDPENYLPHFAISEAEAPRRFLKLGSWKLPMEKGGIRLCREGKPFWNLLEEAGQDCTIFKIPSNYPPSPMERGRSIAGMGTPDITGDSYGVYTIFTTDEGEASRSFSAAKALFLIFDPQGAAESEIVGPPHPLKEEETLSLPLKVYWDKRHRTARLDVAGREILLAEGGVSPWIPLKFPLMPFKELPAMVRFQLLEAGERFRLYLSPLSLDPADPAQPICEPSDYGKELVHRYGRFHTLGLPADTKAFSDGTFDVQDFLSHSETILHESERIFAGELERFSSLSRGGMLFFYFSSVDQGSHMFWSLRDEGHPLHKPEERKRYGDPVENLYLRFDRILDRAMKGLPKGADLIVLSDHGFTTFRRKVNINTLLQRDGFLKLKSGYDLPVSLYEGALWGETQAYALGLNGLYLNLKGREGEGAVDPSERSRKVQELKTWLLSLKDPGNGAALVTKVTVPEREFSGPWMKRGPDIIVGFNDTYRIDNDSALGTLTPEGVKENRDRWSGDHCVDSRVVPALLMTSFPCKTNRAPVIWDLAPTILKLFSLTPPSEMRGKSLIEAR